MADIPLTPAELKLKELRRIRSELMQDAASQEASKTLLQKSRWCGRHCVYPDACTPVEQSRNRSAGCVLSQLSERARASFLDKLFGNPYEAQEHDALEKIYTSRYYTINHQPALARIRHLKGGFDQWVKSRHQGIVVNPRPERQLMMRKRHGL